MNAIEFENVSKQYRLGLVGTGTLAHDIRRFWVTNILRQEDPYLKIGETNDRASKGNSEYVWALRDITFNVEQGDVVGIIGKNGAGKSTLLKLLSRVTGPTTGQIRAHGRIGSLLEVGTGFHAEMTGRENIFMNGAILGMTHNEIQRKLDEIIDFSGCERYIDTPVKRYSSGMMVRLGFAVAAHLDPEILVVDEVLAVGDAEFQKKAIGKMQDVSKGEGRTVLFVSHNMASIRQLCKSGVLLEQGRVRFQSNKINEVVDTYLSDKNFESGIRVIDTKPTIMKSNIIRIDKILVNGQEGNTIDLMYPNRIVTFRIEGFAKRNVKLAFECEICDVKETKVATYSPCLNGEEALIVEDDKPFVIEKEMQLPMNMTNGEYLLNLELCQLYLETYARWESAVRMNLSNYASTTGTAFSHANAGFFNLPEVRL